MTSPLSLSITGQSGPRLPVQLRGKRGMRSRGGAPAVDGPPRGGRHLLRMLQDASGMEVRTRLRVQPKVQRGQVHHRARSHDQGQPLG